MTGWALAQVELRLTVNPETTAFGRAEPFRAGISIQIGARGHARIEMHLYHFLAIDPAGVGRDYRRMLGEACFARPEARSCVGHAFAEAIFDQQIAPQQAEIAGSVIAEPFESGGNRSEERRERKASVRRCRSRWSSEP